MSNISNKITRAIRFSADGMALATTSSESSDNPGPTLGNYITVLHRRDGSTYADWAKLASISPVVDILWMDNSTNRLLSLMENGSIMLWDVSNAYPQVLIDNSTKSPSCFHYSQHRVVVGFPGEQQIRQWSFVAVNGGITVQEEKSIKRIGEVTTAIIHGLDPTVIFGGKGSNLHYATFGADQWYSIDLTGSLYITSIESSFDKGFLVVVALAANESRAYLLDSRSMTVLQQFNSTPARHSIQAIFLPTDRFIAMGSETGRVRVWEITSGTLISEFNDINGARTARIAATVDATEQHVTLALPNDRTGSLVFKKFAGWSTRSGPGIGGPNFTLQILSCGSKRTLHLPICAECQVNVGRQEDDQRVCSFLGFRDIGIGPEEGKYRFKQCPSPGPRFRPIHTSDLGRVKEIKVAIAKMLLPFLKSEVQHSIAPNFVQQYLDPRYRRTCDGCSKGCLWGLFWCRKCARDICSQCLPHQEVVVTVCQVDDPSHDFVPTSCIPSDDLKRHLAAVDDLLKGEILPAKPTQRNGSIFAKVLHVASANDTSNKQFRELWKARNPFVITLGQQKHFQPQYFIDSFRGHPCQVSVAGSPEEMDTTVDEFFRHFSGQKKGQGLKLRDWPPHDDMYPDIANKFHAVVPFSDCTAPLSIANLWSCYPLNTATPDIGPKLYAGTAKTHTNLHVDATDAVNILFYAPKVVEATIARWLLIFDDDASLVQNYLQDKYALDESGRLQSILSGNYSIEEGDLDDLKNLGMRYFEYEQCEGDAIFIPAGWPHQVLNATGSIKIATDFISSESLPTLLKLGDDLAAANRAAKQNGGDIVREDLLGLEFLIWFAWLRWYDVAE